MIQFFERLFLDEVTDRHGTHMNYAAVYNKLVELKQQ